MSHLHGGRPPTEIKDGGGASTAAEHGEPTPARGHHRSARFPRARSDADTRAELDALLASCNDFDPNRVEVLVREGTVVLLGEVANHSVKRRLEQLCAEVRGVREIHDQLQVADEPGAESSDGLRMQATGTTGRADES